MFSGFVGLVLLTTAGAYAAREYDVVDALLVLGGVLVPIWLVWTGSLLRDGIVEPTTSGVVQ